MVIGCLETSKSIFRLYEISQGWKAQFGTTQKIMKHNIKEKKKSYENI